MEKNAARSSSKAVDITFGADDLGDLAVIVVGNSIDGIDDKLAAVVDIRRRSVMARSQR